MLTALVLIAALPSDCAWVPNDRIEARHLVKRIPALQALPPEAEFGFAPRFGVRRAIPGHELEAFARRYGVTATGLPDVCVSRPGRALTEETVRRSVEESAKTLAQGGTAQIELLDYAKHQVPFGEISFPAAGLSRSSAVGAVIWRGFVQDSLGHRYPVWARVRAWQERKVLVAAVEIPAREPIQEGWLVVESRRLHLGATPTLSATEEAVGRLAHRTIATGDPIASHRLLQPREIKAGDAVVVAAESGAAKLTITAKAETPGRRGERITLRNPESGQRFQAVVTGPRAAATVGGRQ